MKKLENRDGKESYGSDGQKKSKNSCDDLEETDNR